MQNISQKGNLGSPRTFQTQSTSGLRRSYYTQCHTAAPSGPRTASHSSSQRPQRPGSPHTHPGATTWPGCAHSSRTTPARSDLSLRSVRAARTQLPEAVRAGAGAAGSAEAAASYTASTEPMRTAAPAATFHSSRRSGVGPGQRTSAPAAAGAPSAGTPAAGSASIATQRAARAVGTTEVRKEAQALRARRPPRGAATLRFPLRHRLHPPLAAHSLPGGVLRHGAGPAACGRVTACSPAAGKQSAHAKPGGAGLHPPGAGPRC